MRPHISLWPTTHSLHADFGSGSSSASSASGTPAGRGHHLGPRVGGIGGSPSTTLLGHTFRGMRRFAQCPHCSRLAVNGTALLIHMLGAHFRPMTMTELGPTPLGSPTYATRDPPTGPPPRPGRAATMARTEIGVGVGGAAAGGAGDEGAFEPVTAPIGFTCPWCEARVSNLLQQEQHVAFCPARLDALGLSFAAAAAGHISPASDASPPLTQPAYAGSAADHEGAGTDGGATSASASGIGGSGSGADRAQVHRALSFSEGASPAAEGSGTGTQTPHRAAFVCAFCVQRFESLEAYGDHVEPDLSCRGLTRDMLL